MKISMRPDQQIVIPSIDRGNVAHKIPDVGAYSEFVDLSDVDRDSHD
jgi:hypothetical protein